MVWTQEEEHDYLSVPWEDEFFEGWLSCNVEVVRNFQKNVCKDQNIV